MVHAWAPTARNLAAAGAGEQGGARDAGERTGERGEHDPCSLERRRPPEVPMLFVIAAILFAFWILGLAFKITTGLIHIALVAAIILFILGFFRGRRSAAAP